MKYLQRVRRSSWKGWVQVKGDGCDEKGHKHSKPIPTNIPMLLYCENNGGMSLCLVEENIPRFLSTAPKDHGHFTAQLYLKCIIEWAY